MEIQRNYLFEPDLLKIGGFNEILDYPYTAVFKRELAKLTQKVDNKFGCRLSFRVTIGTQEFLFLKPRRDIKTTVLGLKKYHKKGGIVIGANQMIEQKSALGKPYDYYGRSGTI